MTREELNDLAKEMGAAVQLPPSLLVDAIEAIAEAFLRAGEAMKDFVDSLQSLQEMADEAYPSPDPEKERVRELRRIYKQDPRRLSSPHSIHRPTYIIDHRPRVRRCRR